MNRFKKEWFAKSVSAYMLIAAATATPVPANVAVSSFRSPPAAPLTTRQVLPILGGEGPRRAWNPAKHESTLTVPG